MSGCANSAAASATRIRQPPENSAIGRVRSAVEKPRPAQNFAGAGGRAIGVDLDQPAIDVAHALPVRRVSSSQIQRLALDVGRQHGVQQR